MSRLLAQIILLSWAIIPFKKKTLIAISSCELSKKKQPVTCANGKFILNCPECSCIQIWICKFTFESAHTLSSYDLILSLLDLKLSSWNLWRATVSPGMICAHPCPQMVTFRETGGFLLVNMLFGWYLLHTKYLNFIQRFETGLFLNKKTCLLFH